MVLIGKEFVLAQVPEEEKLEGTQVDPNVIALLPSGSNILSSSTLGATHGAIQRKIQVLLPGEKHHEYFLKLFILEQTADMARGEHEATKHWWKLLPDNVPRPWGWGECANRPGIFFVLLDYVHMDTDFDKLDVHRFLSRLCHVHAQSSSPTGKFGFPYTTFAGTHANDNSWCDTWEEYLVRDFKTLMRCEMETHGLDQELEQLEEQIITRVVPRLIRPLETGGRHIRPTLVHGDLWHGNIGTNVATGEPVMYDFGSFYAHDELELTMWNAERYLLKQDHRNLYWKLRKMGSDGAHGERDQPDVALHGEEVDYESKDDPERKDRNLLYASRSDIAVSYTWKHLPMRNLAKERFRILIDKYGEGYEGWFARQETVRTTH